MKPRTVIVTLEVESNEPLRDLRNKTSWRHFAADVGQFTTIKQVQVAVAQPPKEKK